MSESIRACAIGIAFAIICILVKNFRNEFLIPTRIASIIIIVGISILMLIPILKFLTDIMGKFNHNEYLELMLKSLAIAYVTSITSDICRDCGEGGIATSIEIVGKVEILLLSLPLINKIINLSEGLVSW